MSDIVNDYFKRFYGERPRVFPRMTCVDGFEMSVQGHYGAYCTPRIDFAERYSAVEVGFPSSREEALMPYIDGDPETTDPTSTVYGYVPIEVIEQIIAQHGGMKT